jgi:hypothetical protein
LKVGESIAVIQNLFHGFLNIHSVYFIHFV